MHSIHIWMTFSIWSKYLSSRIRNKYTNRSYKIKCFQRKTVFMDWKRQSFKLCITYKTCWKYWSKTSIFSEEAWVYLEILSKSFDRYTHLYFNFRFLNFNFRFLNLKNNKSNIYLITMNIFINEYNEYNFIPSISMLAIKETWLEQ